MYGKPKDLKNSGQFFGQNLGEINDKRSAALKEKVKLISPRRNSFSNNVEMW